MKFDKRESGRRLLGFERVLRNAGVHATHQRTEIIHEVARRGSHPDANAIHRAVRRKARTVSLDTVDRARRLCCDLGLITTLGTPREPHAIRCRSDSAPFLRLPSMRNDRDFHDNAFDELRLPRWASTSAL